MDTEFDQANAVVLAAFKQKYGTEPRNIDVESRRATIVAGLSASSTSKQRSLEIIRQLVHVYENEGQAAAVDIAPAAAQQSEPKSAPAGATLINDLDNTQASATLLPAPSNVKLAPTSRVQTSSTLPFNAPFASAQFVELLPVSGSALKATFPLGMSRVGGIFFPIRSGQAILPCLMLDIEPHGESQTTNLVVLTSQSKLGAYYKCEKPLEIGPSAVGDQIRKIWLRDCTNEEISFGVDASIGKRVTVQGIQTQKRFHVLTVVDNDVLTPSTDVSTMRVFDDSGDIVGPLSRLVPTDTSGSFRPLAKGENRDDEIYAVEMSIAGAGPVSVYISASSPSLCII